ncbi:rho-related BTB domain-containing protein 1-like isoform X2 [Oppia nitens]|uniref:rho-related BTB domain-containing protein 1-like isoform X2 n=1 Tax=Oppia nitens TaxID=1686743 RepID=UPI0023DA0A64|nr:rho-related BTB domain-containing protein 1-like isoform X2 [Oppia nitens]
MDNEQPHQELVKCVVVGDTAVGKTRLICARACNSRLDLTQLMTTHIPTVWAIDQYRIHKEVLQRSWEVVDGVNVSLRLWDTFGDHDKDRRFAYGRSDVVLLCFSVANPISLRNCKVIWYPEIRRFCPNTPIVLVGCKNDLRYMFRDEKFLTLCRERSPFFRPLKETDILTPEQGRMVAKDIDAPYYEASVFTHFGVNEVFENVIRMALIARRQQRFWMTNLKHVQKSLIQEPFCPPQPLSPKIVVPNSQFEQHLSLLLETQAYTDIIVSIGKSGICAHKVILAAASQEFYKLLTMDITNTYGNEFSSNSSPGFWGRSASDSSITSSATDVSVGNFNTDTEQLLSTSPAGGPVDSGHTNKLYTFRASQGSTSPSGSDSMTANLNVTKKRSNFRNQSSDLSLYRTGVHKSLNHSLFQSISVELGENVIDCSGRLASNVQTVVAMTNAITMGAIHSYIRFIYSTKLSVVNETPVSELYDIAELLGLQELQVFLRNLEDLKESDIYFNQTFINEFSQKLKRNLKTICLDEGLFADVIFKLEDGTCCGHKAILMSRCDVMDAMFRGDFKESLAKVIPFPGVVRETFRQMLYYLYTDGLDTSITHTNCLPVLELANRLCLSRLVALIENHIINELTRISESGDITEIVLRLLEPSQIHNADQLSEYCLHQIAIHYNEICHKNTKLLRSLHPENQAYLNRNRWPPVWYLKEFDYFERCVRERQWQEKPKGLKRHRLNSGCLCFSVKNRRNDSKQDMT